MMRLCRLDLTRYGLFTGHSLDFGSIKEGKPDLHVIFGPNEAGKTTAFEGYLDLLFGIPMRSPYNYLHSYDNMLVGGALGIDGSTVELVRIKKTRNDLLDANGDPVNAAVLLSALGGITREQYRAMFSLDDETIEAGGEDILASQGSLGELLFSAAAGLSDLGSALDQARTEIDTFHKARSRSTFLGTAKKDLSRLQAEIRDIDMNASAFHTLRKAKDDAQARHEEAKTERDRLMQEKSHLEAILECLPLLPKLNDISKAMSNFDAYPVIPDDWVEEVRTLHTQHVQAHTEKKRASANIIRLTELRDGLGRDPSILSIKEELAVLLGASKSRAQTADEDLPRRRTELADYDADIDLAFKQLKLKDAGVAQLSEPLIFRMEELAETWSTTEQALFTAREEQRKAEESINKLLEEKDASENDAVPGVDLPAILDRLDPENLAGSLRMAEEAVQTASIDAAASLIDLVPWVGEIAQLPKVDLTDDQARRLVDRWASMTDELSDAKKKFGDATLQLSQRTARLVEMEGGESFFTEAEAKVARSARGDAWTHHLSNMTPETADAFHQAMVRSDTIQDARLGMAERIAQVREVRLSKLELELTEDHFRRLMATHEVEITAEREGLTAQLGKLGLPDTFDARDLPVWLKKMVTAHRIAAELEKKSSTLSQIALAASNAEDVLRKALAVNSEAGGLQDLARLARSKMTTAAQQLARFEARQNAIKEASVALDQRKNAAARLEEDLAKAKAEWARHASDMPLTSVTPLEFRTTLPIWRQLNIRLADREKLSRRIAAMEEDQSSFAEKLEGLAETVDENANSETLVLAERLQKRLTDEDTCEVRYVELSKTIDAEAGFEGTANQGLDSIAMAVREKAKSYPPSIPVETIDDLVAVVTASEKAAKLRSDFSELANRIVARLGAVSLESGMEALAAEDMPSAQALLESAQQDLSLTEKYLSQAIGDLRAARDKLESIGGDNAVARLEEKRQTVLLSIGDEARRSLRLRLGVMAAEQALAQYRDAHRSRMLSDAAEAFRQLTAGHYNDLKTQSDGQKEILLALRGDDMRSISATEMSKGTRFQLYLALRLAGYRQFRSNGNTLPFVADDIMETFDNTRTSAALGLMQEIALSGQALYFTHHEHVVELAREICGDEVTIHNLAVINDTA